MSSEADTIRTASYARRVLAMLLLVYVFNFLDRQILGMLAQPIKAELGLTDTQLGALGGVAFAVLYSTLGIPLGLLADRTSRSWVIVGSLALWSAFTAICGLATSFWTLFFCRVGVGVGEAGGVAPSYAIISDYCPPERRARALAIYSMGVPVGLASGALIGGMIGSLLDWRTAFLIVGAAGLVLAPFVRLVVRDPIRIGQGSAVVPSEAVSPLSMVFSILARKPSFWLLSVAAAASSVCGYGLAFWLPSLLIRSFGFDLLGASKFYGSLLLVGGTLGVLAGGVLADKYGALDRGNFAKLPAVAFLVTIPFFLFGFWTKSPMLAWVCLVIPNGLNLLWVGPVVTAIQNLVPSRMRATASACFLFINNMIGLGAGAVIMGAMSDAMKAYYGDQSLRYSLSAATGFYLLAAVLMLFAVRHLRKDWVA